MNLAALAAAIVDGGEPVPPDLPAEALRALAWALKDVCHAAWSSAPQRAVRAAAVLQALPAADPEVGALAHWTAGLAAIIRGAMADAVVALDAAAALFEGAGRADRAAETQVPKIMALAMLGELDAATRCAERTRSAFVAQGDLRAASKVALNLGSLQLRRHHYRAAARQYREAAVGFARVGDREHSVMADVGLADALASQGDFDEAERIGARARMRAEAHDFPVLRAIACESLALLDLARGRYREALVGFEAARRGYEALAMPQHLAIAEKQLADAYLELRMLPEARALLEVALAKFEALQMPSEEAWTLAQRGRAEALAGEPAAAAAAFERAAALFVAQDSPIGEAAVTLARAELALAGDDAVPAGEAGELAQRAHEAYAAAGSIDGVARARVVLADALLRAGRAGEAHATYAATLERARAAQQLTVQVRCLAGLGLAAEAAGDAAGAAEALDASIALFEEQQRALPGDEIRSAFLTGQLRAYEAAVRIALARHDAAPGPAAAADVLRRLDRYRARALGERLARPQHDGPAGGDAAAGRRDRLSWLYRRVQRMHDDGEPAAELEEEMRATELALLEHQRRQRLSGSAAAPATGAGDAASDVDALRAALAADEALVAYGIDGDALYACLVRPAGVEIVRGFAAWPDALAAAEAVRFQIDTLRHGAARVAEHLPALVRRAEVRLHAAWQGLWAPLAPRLAGVDRVTVVAPARLGSLPFAALQGPDGPLAMRRAIVMAPSVRVAMRGIGRQPSPPCRALAFGVSERLPHAAGEARMVAALFPQGEARIDADATTAALAACAGDADVLHLACHAQFRSDNPLFSAVHLHDAALPAERVEHLSLRAGLVVLSGCETGLADGDEIFGLVRAFLLAGAGRVLASLWPVEDAVAALFMDAFYRAFLRGASAADALQAAQRAVMLRHPHPFHWAAFALFGGG